MAEGVGTSSVCYHLTIALRIGQGNNILSQWTLAAGLPANLFGSDTTGQLSSVAHFHVLLTQIDKPKMDLII